MSRLTRTIRRNMIRHTIKKEGRRHYNRTRDRDQYGNKLPSVFALLYKKITGIKPGKVQRIRNTHARNI
ncbi:MAG: hypothetical protein ACYCWE_09760 [Eubacteriales bacterium]